MKFYSFTYDLKPEDVATRGSKFTCHLWALIFCHWLKPGEHVVRVLGWREAHVQLNGIYRYIKPGFSLFTSPTK